ncbi:hypothetical protein CH333_05355 [candidate division WOR-3 bacterium JGI_Cruoil_03_44_89]|uniref:PD-(D/E)XK endonuclease-like domain-containing protein n=1 Tax=candidate division WOR-3 bacterium JGI_Cruoil_03_44_89 TaxID=1973748 RepID=A0A235BTT1_UNCW3|nr:MAG: hypothetical protein CH333_05355 [candidate division WOR-3 bacterium JGI_Cruoil_03_44_89]
MFQIVAMWNLSRPDEEMKESVENTELRGYNPKTILTGEFAIKIANEEVKPLSVSNIADRYCFTRRDLYFSKGVNRLRGKNQKETWGSKAGPIVENYIEQIFVSENTKNLKTYESVREKGHNIYSKFIKEKSDRLEELKTLEENSLSTESGDTRWLLKLLNNNGRAELAIQALHTLLKENGFLDTVHINIKEKIKPNSKQIGISPAVEPDFIIPKFGIVGDVKTGVEFKDHFLLTCAGYALAYENENGKDKDINWGIIYFFPTRNPSWMVKPLTFAQIYIFPIDDHIREWFLDVRDEAYNIISKNKPPGFPPENKREHCKHCKFKDNCKREGLELREDE